MLFSCLVVCSNLQQDCHPTKQQDCHPTKQQDNKTTKQQDNQTTKQQALSGRQYRAKRE